MGVKIHPSAVIDQEAKIGRDVQIGAYCVVGPHVTLGNGCRLHHHATVEGHTTLGEGCEVFPQALLGLSPQDLKYRGECTTLQIGKNNIFREMVTAHPGTANGGGITRVGDDNLFLVGVHIAHDCRIGNHCIVANYVQFAGHVHVEDNVNIGGATSVHHFATIGRYAFIGGMTRVSADVPPYLVVVAARGSRAEARMVNGVGLQRSGFSQDDIAALKSAYMRIFSRRARLSGIGIRDRVQAVLAERAPSNTHVDYLCNFLLRSFAHGRHGRYLESLRADPVYRNTWKLKNGFTLTLNVQGNGSVDRKWTQDDGRNGELMELTAKPDDGWDFAGWNGGLTGQINPVDVALDRDMVVTATFTPAGA